jgi:Flp pilus assembly protein TadB
MIPMTSYTPGARDLSCHAATASSLVDRGGVVPSHDRERHRMDESRQPQAGRHRRPSALAGPTAILGGLAMAGQGHVATGVLVLVAGLVLVAVMWRRQDGEHGGGS